MPMGLLLGFLLLTSSFASEVCDFDTTGQWHDAYPLHTTVTQHQNFTLLERALIWKAIASDNYYADLNQDQALLVFSVGYNAGEIAYYHRGSKVFALVHYWPGENEYGAFFEILSEGKFKLVATVQDGDIYCQ
jgi:hypothetical protein